MRRALPTVQHLTSLAGADQLCALHQLRRQRPTPSALSGVAYCASRSHVAAAYPAPPQAERLYAQLRGPTHACPLLHPWDRSQAV
eukprot:scaffold45093_cov74-Phaeocystis_antarctica.AAC.4